MDGSFKFRKNLGRPSSLAATALLLALVISPVVAQAQSKTRIPAPLGLKWGWTQTDLKRVGVRIIANDPANAGLARILRVYNTPKEIAGASTVFLLVTNRYGLQRVLWASPTYRNDKFGLRAKTRYSELKEALSDKYGPPNSYEWISKRQKYAAQTDFFYICMRTKGCGSWTSFWTRNYIGSIRLSIRGFKQGNKGYVSLRYEGPQFSRFLYDVKKRREKGAL